MSRTYFISYAYTLNHNSGHGMTEVTLLRGIDNFKDVLEVAAHLQGILGKGSKAIILNWREIDAPEASKTPEERSDSEPSPSSPPEIPDNCP